MDLFRALKEYILQWKKELSNIYHTSAMDLDQIMSFLRMDVYEPGVDGHLQ